MTRNWALVVFTFSCSSVEFSLLDKVLIQYRTPFIHCPWKFRLPTEPFFRLRKTLHESNQTFSVSMLYCTLLGYSFEFRLNCNSRVREAAASVMTISVLSNQFDGLWNPFKERKQDWQIQKFHGAAATSRRRLQKLYAIQADKTRILFNHTQKKRHKKGNTNYVRDKTPWK